MILSLPTNLNPHLKRHLSTNDIKSIYWCLFYFFFFFLFEISHPSFSELFICYIISYRSERNYFGQVWKFGYETFSKKRGFVAVLLVLFYSLMLSTVTKHNHVIYNRILIIMKNWMNYDSIYIILSPNWNCYFSHLKSFLSIIYIEGEKFVPSLTNKTHYLHPILSLLKIYNSKNNSFIDWFIIVSSLYFCPRILIYIFNPISTILLFLQQHYPQSNILTTYWKC